MKRNARFELRMTQEEMDVLLKFAGKGKRSEFIRRAIKAAIMKKVRSGSRPERRRKKGHIPIWNRRP